MLAFRAHLQIVFQRLSPDNLPAMFALEPQPFRADTPPAFFGINRRFVASEPSHCKYQCTVVGGQWTVAGGWFRSRITDHRPPSTDHHSPITSGRDAPAA